MSKAIEHIARHYGYDAQSRQLIEEMAELTQAVNKFWRKELGCGVVEFYGIRKTNEFEKSACFNNMVEEIADVEVMLAQMKVLLNCEDMVEQAKDYKVRRQLERIKDK
jgi:NTP pyrophosphatase (non-canonical NTP hydrolase)